MDATRRGFIECMDDDFNCAGALGNIFELVRSINQARDARVHPEMLQEAQDLLRELTSVLGLRLEYRAPKGEKAGDLVDLLVELRSELRRKKLWALSDKIRDRLAEMGVILEDAAEITTWRWK
jgi:cysteinyl-tRNA synthetase